MNPVLVLDTNLIILLIVGLADEKSVPTHKRTRAYSVNDFRLLLKIISTYEDMRVIPNALSEASNLLDFEGDGLPAKIFACFSHFVSTTKECYIPSLDALQRNEIRRLGLTDTATLELGKEGFHILSADAGLCIAASRAGYIASNFIHAIEAARFV
ncbi:hypothetical protein [Bradyrhizobium sp.]|uniref:hypothetical protein n=1 Tax=Bradyrhizobium sp. TaxID=376 RepID=UPI002725123F|nr:hypothetical protein [Bradyrhizobium sp.]MDO9298441.1 hypothetical protein [Bradyrhizobium sp.]